MRVLLAGTHAAAGQYILALLPEIERRGHHGIVTLAGAAAEMLDGQVTFTPAESMTADELLATIKPDHFCCCITGVVAEDPWEKQLAEEAHRRGIIWTGHEDMELTATLEQHRPLWRSLNPARIFAAEQTSVQGLTELGVLAEKIMVVGNPTWDKLADFDGLAARAKIRQQLQLRNGERLIVWLAPKTEIRAREEWELILGTLNWVAGLDMRLTLVAYFHPGCPDWKGTATADKPHGLYQKDLDNAHFRTLAGSILNGKEFNQTAVLASADLVISFASTETITTAMLGVPTVRPFTPTNLAYIAGQNRPQPHLFGPVATGCQIAVRSPEEWRDVCLKLLQPSSLLLGNLRTNCALHYPRGGGYAKRIVQEIENLH